MASSTRTKILAGNWKMNLGPAEAAAYFEQLGGEQKKAFPKSPEPPKNLHWVVFPPAYALDPATQRAAWDRCVALGAQNVHWEAKGAFTGELSATVLKSLGIKWVLIGHSERRQYFGETDDTASKRFAFAADSGLNIIFCLGERLEERESGQTESVLTRQTQALCRVLKERLGRQGAAIWSIAYEPVWAIGTGKTATTEQAEQAHQCIREVLERELGSDAASKMPILYGGSVTSENAAQLLDQPNVDGVLVGGASLKPDSFCRILASI